MGGSHLSVHDIEAVEGQEDTILSCGLNFPLAVGAVLDCKEMSLHIGGTLSHEENAAFLALVMDEKEGLTWMHT